MQKLMVGCSLLVASQFSAVPLADAVGGKSIQRSSRDIAIAPSSNYSRAEEILPSQASNTRSKLMRRVSAENLGFQTPNTTTDLPDDDTSATTSSAPAVGNCTDEGRTLIESGCESSTQTTCNNNFQCDGSECKLCKQASQKCRADEECTHSNETSDDD
eukprot:TRINITY_DN25953_c0_g1_i1.p1 TRINITY_DN25953_c0_g1~~TRINITY_DN25953_c0_g1_i1.p1  ORF type:complete len:159 (+),score=23.17 TRINITY_DN25953_c0_g1_i1:139-615(+)